MLSAVQRLEKLLIKQRELRDAFFEGARPATLDAVLFALGQDDMLREMIRQTEREARGRDDEDDEG